MVEVINLAEEKEKKIALQKELADKIVEGLNEPIGSLEVEISDLVAYIRSSKSKDLIALTCVRGDKKEASINLMQEEYFGRVLTVASSYESSTGRKVTLRKDYGDQKS